MSLDWSAFDDVLDLEVMQGEIEKASKNDGDFPEIPHGSYEVQIVKLELRQTKKEPIRPMFTAQMKIINHGELDGNYLFMNQVMWHEKTSTTAFFIHKVQSFLESLGTDIDVTFNGFDDFEELLISVFEYIENNKLEYALEYTDNKGFDNFEIIDVFEV